MNQKYQGPNLYQPTPTRLAFYKAKGTWVDRLIRWGSSSPYSHVELIGPDGQGWSASPRDGKVRKTEIDFDSGHWDIIELPWKNLDVVADRVNDEMGKKYDWIGVISNHVVRLVRPSRGKWFCSELVAHGLGLDKPHTYSPGSLADTVRYMTTFYDKLKEGL